MLTELFSNSRGFVRKTGGSQKLSRQQKLYLFISILMNSQTHTKKFVIQDQWLSGPLGEQFIGTNIIPLTSVFQGTVIVIQINGVLAGSTH